MRDTVFPLILIGCLLFAVPVHADLIVDVTPGEDGDAAKASLADFQEVDTKLAEGTAINTVKSWAELGKLESDGLKVSVSGTGNGRPNNGFNSGSDSWTFGKPIVQGYLYENEDHPVVNTVTVSGLGAYKNGEAITLTVWAIGDKVGQNTSVTAKYAGKTTDSETAYNAGGGHDDATGAKAAVQFHFVADGTDQISFDWGAPEAATAALNGFSISIAAQ